MIYDELFNERLLSAVDYASHVSPQTGVSWLTVMSTMTQFYPDLKLSKSGLRSRYSRLINPDLDKESRGTVKRKTTLEKQVLAMLSKTSARTASHVAGRLGISETEVISTVTKLSLTGYPQLKVWSEEGVFMVGNIKKPVVSHKHEDMVGLFESTSIQFAVVSDTHMGSNQYAQSAHAKFYSMLKERGISVVYHVGDISDGYYTNRPASLFEQYAHGYTEQLRDIVLNYPNEAGITTYFITGNHDHTHFRNGFADIGEAVSDARDDLIYLGHNHAKVDVSEGVTLSMIHPTDGASRSLSLKLQHIIERNPERSGDIMLVGHYHKACNIFYNGVHGYMVPSFQHKTRFMDDNNLVSLVGGMIFTIKVDPDSGKMLSIGTEYFDYS